MTDHSPPSTPLAPGADRLDATRGLVAAGILEREARLLEQCTTAAAVPPPTPQALWRLTAQLARVVRFDPALLDGAAPRNAAAEAWQLLRSIADWSQLAAEGRPGSPAADWLILESRCAGDDASPPTAAEIQAVFRQLDDVDLVRAWCARQAHAVPSVQQAADEVRAAFRVAPTPALVAYELIAAEGPPARSAADPDWSGAWWKHTLLQQEFEQLTQPPDREGCFAPRSEKPTPGGAGAARAAWLPPATAPRQMAAADETSPRQLPVLAWRSTRGDKAYLNIPAFTDQTARALLVFEFAGAGGLESQRPGSPIWFCLGGWRGKVDHTGQCAIPYPELVAIQHELDHLRVETQAWQPEFELDQLSAPFGRTET